MSNISLNVFFLSNSQRGEVDKNPRPNVKYLSECLLFKQFTTGSAASHPYC